MMHKIHRLFDSIREPRSEMPKKYLLGEIPLFARQTNSQTPTLFVIISLYCETCIELLPKLQSIADAFDGETVLVTDGDANEAREIRNHFNFSFDVLPTTAKEFVEVYRPEFTPYAYVLNDDQTIAYMGDLRYVNTTKGTIAQLGLIPIEKRIS